MKKRKENELFSLTTTRQELGGTSNRAYWGYPYCVWSFILVKKTPEYQFILHSRIQIGFNYPSVIFLHFGEEGG